MADTHDVVPPWTTHTLRDVVLKQYCSPPLQLTLKWSIQKRAPEAIMRGVAVVHGTIAYIIGDGSCTIYSYQLDGSMWSKHSECPHINPGLIIINNLLTAVGGKIGDWRTSGLATWNQSKWVHQFPSMRIPREEPALVQYGTYVIAIGGDHEKKAVELLHIPSLLWSRVTSLRSPLKYIYCHSVPRDNSYGLFWLCI